MTPREAGQFRRESDLPWYWQFIHFVLAPWVDHWTGLSLTRLLATAFGALACYVSVVTKHIGAGAVTLAVFAIATAFGKQVFTEALKRWRGGSESTQSDSKVDVTETVRVFTQESGHAFAVADPAKG